MKIYKICFFLLLMMPVIAFSQQEPVDSVAVYVGQVREIYHDNTTKAFSILKKAEKLASKSGKRIDKAKVLYSYAITYYVKGAYDLSLANFLEAQEIYAAEGDELGVAHCLSGQGLIQQGIDRNAEAINFFEQAIAKYKESGNIEKASPSYLNIAISNIEVRGYEEARKNLATAITLARKAGREHIVHLSHNKLAEIHFLKGEFDKAKIYYQKVLNDETEANSWEKSFAYAGLAQANMAQKKLDSAQVNAIKAVSYAREVNSLWDMERNTAILSSVYEETGNIAQAHKVLKLNQKYRDSLYDQMKLREINLMQLESKEVENSILTAEKEIAEKRLYIDRIIIAFLAVLTILLLLLFYFYRKHAKQKLKLSKELKEKNKTIVAQNELIVKQNEDLTDLNRSKDKLFSILSHDLRSPIGSIQQLLQLIKSGDFTAEEQKNLLDEMLIQVTGTSAMLHNLLHWANTQLEGSKTKPKDVQLQKKVEKIIEAHYLAAKNKNIHIRHAMPASLSVIKIDEGQLSVIIHNLVSNAIKFTREGKPIDISYKEDKKYVHLSIKDGGEGISEEKIKEIKSTGAKMISEVGTSMETGTGIGLMLVKQFLEANHAALDVKAYPGEGSEFVVSFLKTKQ